MTLGSVSFFLDLSQKCMYIKTNQFISLVLKQIFHLFENTASSSNNQLCQPPTRSQVIIKFEIFTFLQLASVCKLVHHLYVDEMLDAM